VEVESSLECSPLDPRTEKDLMEQQESRRFRIIFGGPLSPKILAIAKLGRVGLRMLFMETTKRLCCDGRLFAMF
jgi:hypothetical protein